ncbi:hypothetical protein D9758_007107 [Tetrapyrgos nigripes]|uniref:Uncharacterized protein n=1 Tax=Tetrapyrgos nigripes TaxID=182062 RepID=A0A8H5GDD0_9AGAR|nr:hypothetical protein D9758_007107 [Tetrapyrgos nigripes]
MSPLDLTSKIALVTDGGTGIGLTIAKELSKNGAKVYITGRRLEVLQKTAGEDPGLIPLQMDITDKQSIANAVKCIDETEGKLDILVNKRVSAGVTGPSFPVIIDRSATTANATSLGDALFMQDSFDQWADVFKTNTFAPYFVMMGFLSLLERGARARNRETSSVVNISSGAGTGKLLSACSAYPISKAGINHLTSVWATEFAIHKIPVRVSCIAAGIFPSELTGTAEEVAAALAIKPLPGLLSPAPLMRAGKQIEIGTMAVFLSSLAGESTNGAIIPVDGGHLVWSILE